MTDTPTKVGAPLEAVTRLREHLSFNEYTIRHNGAEADGELWKRAQALDAAAAEVRAEMEASSGPGFAAEAMKITDAIRQQAAEEAFEIHAKASLKMVARDD